MRDLIVYTLLRLGLFAVLWWLLTLLGLHYLIAGVAAAFLAMLISFVALNRQRDRVAMRWKAADDRRRERRGEVRDEDADEEDALLGDDPEPEPGTTLGTGADAEAEGVREAEGAREDEGGRRTDDVREAPAAGRGVTAPHPGDSSEGDVQAADNAQASEGEQSCDSVHTSAGREPAEADAPATRRSEHQADEHQH